MYDGDEAGLKASFRGIDMILESGMNVKIVLFPEGEDPDSFVRNHRTSEVEEFLEKKADNFISFKTKLLMKEADNDPVKKGKTGKGNCSKHCLNPRWYISFIFYKGM